MAKGVKKIIAKNSAFLEPFFLIKAEIVEGKDFFRLTTATPIENFKNIRLDWQKSILANYACEILAKLLLNNSSENKIFNLFFSYLKLLTEVEKADRIFSIAFLWKFFALQGYLPKLDKCVMCEQEDNLNYFSSVSGGLVCDKCKAKNLELQKSILLKIGDKEDLQKLLKNDWKDIKINKENYEKQEQILFDFCAYHSQKKIFPLNKILN